MVSTAKEGTVGLPPVEERRFVSYALLVESGCWLCGGYRMLATAEGSFGAEGDEEIREDGKVAGERGERRGTTLVYVWRVAELGLLKLRWRRSWVCSG